jgi:hypothetical protein
MEKWKGLEIRGPQGQLNRVAGARNPPNGYDHLSALHHSLVNDDSVNLSCVRVQDHAANRSDGLAFRINYSGAKGNEHL